MKRAIIFIFLAGFFLSACQGLGFQRPTATFIPTPTPQPPKELNICVGYEPASLYLYAASSQEAENILEVIYDGPFDQLDNGEMQPVVFEKVPDLVDGSARFTPVGVAAGDEVVNVSGYATILQAGTQVFPSGCTSPACAVTWDGATPLQMDQISADFTLVSGIRWSDGEALKASDSVFSFDIANNAATPGDKLAVDQTADYVALDEHTVQWTGKPGLVTDAFADYFWTPLPEHFLGAYTAAELLQLEEAQRNPLGWGSFMVSEWAPGEYIRLDKNPNYFRAGEGLPYYDTVFFRFVDPDQIGQVNSEQCDILTDTLLDIHNVESFLSSPAASSMRVQTWPSRDLEMLAFGIKPASYDDNYYPYGVDRPDIFGDARTRQAFAYCLDRVTIAEELLKGYVEPSVSLLPPDDPLLFGAALAEYPYDPAQGMALLDAVGWKDLDQNAQTPLTASAVFNVPVGTPLTVTLYTSDAALQGEIAAEIVSNLGDCGIQADLVQLSSAEVYQMAQESGPVFGRNFDLALIPWRTRSSFNCKQFTTAEIPSDANYWLGELTGGANFYGYSSVAYDQACQTMRSSGLDEGTRDAAEQQVLEILSEELPFVPIFHYPRMYAVNTSLCSVDNPQGRVGYFTLLETLREDDLCP